MSLMAQDDTIYDRVEQMPQYVGGETALFKFIIDNMKYPEEAQKQKKEGRVVVQMVIEKDGAVSDYKVVKSLSPLLDDEAMRVAKMLPNKWKPAKNKGQVVRCHYSIPFVFRLK
jgi:TonB family protein